MTKSKPQIKIINCTTGEEILRDATNDEIAQFEINAENAKAERIAAQEKELQRQAILDRLGLTADEAKLILG
jgi:hypothetical protein